MNFDETNTFETAAVSYLASPECIRMTLDVYELVPKVKETVLLRFWNCMINELKDKLKAYTSWSIQPSSDEDLMKLANYCGIELRQKKAADEICSYEVYFRITFENKAISFGLIMNDAWKNKLEDFPDSLKETMSSLRDRGWKTDYRGKWPAWKDTQINPLSHNTLVDFAKSDSAPKSIAKDFIVFFQEFYLKIEQANQELSKIKIDKQPA